MLGQHLHVVPLMCLELQEYNAVNPYVVNRSMVIQSEGPDDWYAELDFNLLQHKVCCGARMVMANAPK